MPETLALGMLSLGTWLLTYLVHSTVLLGGAWVLTRLRGLRPETHEVIWKTAVLAGIVTSLVAAPAPTPEGVLRRVEALAWTDERAPEGATVHFRARVVEAGAAGGGPAKSGGLRAALALLWGLGAIGGLAGLSGRHGSVRALRRTLRPASRRAVAHLDSLTASWPRARRPTLWTSDAVDSPCVLPGGAIVLSDRCDHDLTDEEMRAVLAHEAAHVRRHDALWSAVMRLAGVVLWVQPLNRVATRSAEQAAELACDDFALTSTGERRGLASSISRIAHWSFVGRTAPGVPMIGGGRRLSERVRRILDDRPVTIEPRWLRPALLALLVLPMHWLPAVTKEPVLHATFIVEKDVRTERGFRGDPAAPAIEIVRMQRTGTRARGVTDTVLRVGTRAPEPLLSGS